MRPERPWRVSVNHLQTGVTKYAEPDGTATGLRGDIEALVAAMTLDEKAALTAGVDSWRTAAVDRLGIGQVKMTDGAARGGHR